jgi:hypothetical protein
VQGEHGRNVIAYVAPNTRNSRAPQSLLYILGCSKLRKTFQDFNRDYALWHDADHLYRASSERQHPREMDFGYCDHEVVKKQRKRAAHGFQIHLEARNTYQRGTLTPSNVTLRSAGATSCLLLQASKCI